MVVVVVNAGVSSAVQCVDLDCQVARVMTWTTGQRPAVSRVVTEVGPALDGQQKRFLVLLRYLQPSTFVVEHRGRFVRFGGEYVEAALSALGRRYGRRAVADRAQCAVDAIGSGLA